MQKYFCENRKEIIDGISFKEEKEIIGIVFNPVDYVLDGLRFLNTEKINNIEIEDDDFKNEVMKRKSEKYLDEPQNRVFKDPSLHSFRDLFQLIYSLDLLCELSLSAEEVVYIGKVINVNEDSIDIDFFDTKCNLMDNAYVEYADMTHVTVFSDYVNTLSDFIK